MAGNGDADRRLHKLIHGERAAVESYTIALEKVTDDASRSLLREFLEDHRRALATLERHAVGRGEEPDGSSGPWGAFSRAVEKSAAWLGDAMALKALKEGEVHGASEYQTALEHDRVSGELRQAVEGELLPAQEEHVAALDRLIARLEAGAAGESLRDRVERARR